MTSKKHKTAHKTAEGPDHAVAKIDSVVMSSGKKRRLNLSKRQLVIAVAAFVVLLAAGAWWYVSRDDQTEPDTTTDESVVQDINYRLAAIESPDYEASYIDYLILGNDYVTVQDYDAALDAYKGAEELKADNFDVKYALATIYRLREDRDQALAYYDDVIDLASTQNINLDVYRNERQAVADGNFDLKGVDYDTDIPL